MKKNKNHLVKKLFFRELFGEIRQCRTQPIEKLFNQLLPRLAFPLSSIATLSALAAGHIYLGFTKCGQFVLSYTFSSDADDLTLQICRRYRLHWWLFVPYKRLRKVAEVTLFGDQNLRESLYENIYISICQWPRDTSKILVFGYCTDEGDFTAGPPNRRVYLTVTAVPSLSNCSDCLQVATSYEEEELAERWNSCVRFSCLRHGVTVHTSFDVVPTYPKFMPKIQLKIDSEIIINTGNFIHILSINLENIDKRMKENCCSTTLVLPQPSVRSAASLDESGDELDVSSVNLSDNSSIVYDMDPPVSYSCESPKISNNFLSNNRLKISLRSQHDIDRGREWEILVGSNHHSAERDDNLACDNISSTFEARSPFPDTSSDHSCSDSYSRISYSSTCNPSRELCKSNLPCLSKSDDDSSLSLDIHSIPGSSIKSTQRPSIFHKPDLCSFPRSGPSCSQPPTRGSSLANSTLPCLSSKRADKEYDFIDEISETRLEKLSVFRRRRLAEKKYEFSDENSENIPLNYGSFRRQSQLLVLSPSRSPHFRSRNKSYSELSVDLEETSDFFKSVYQSLWSPSSSCPSPNDVLRPISQNISSPLQSPRDDKWEKAELQRWSSRDSLIVYSSVSNSRKYESSKVVSQSHDSQNLNCIVDIKRRYIEVDDELVSIITDIEDDELSSATGYHNALPLEVHGSGYCQLQMISKTKAEKLMAPGVLIRQISFDMEQFCHETSQRICAEAGKKYFFCNDYNVEIIDVCPSSRNVICLASILVQAANSKPKAGLASSKSFSRNCANPQSLSSRKLYRTSATFAFNIDTKDYDVLDYEPLEENDPYRLEIEDIDDADSACSGYDDLWWQTSRLKSRELRNLSSIPTSYFSSVKEMTNEALLRGKSLSLILESFHLVAIIMGNINNQLE